MNQRRGAWLTTIIGLGCVVLVYQACGEMHSIGLGAGTSAAGAGNSRASGGGGTSTDNPMTARVQMKIVQNLPAGNAPVAKLCVTGFTAVTKSSKGTTTISSSSSGNSSVVVQQKTTDFGGMMSGFMDQIFDFTDSIISATTGGFLSFDQPWYGTVANTPSLFATGNFEAGDYAQITLEASPNCDSGKSLQLTNSHGVFQSTEPLKLRFAGNLQINRAGELILDASSVVESLGGVRADSEIAPLITATGGNATF